MNRSGLSIAELLVSLSLVTLLMVLILPAIGAAREASRRVTCASHLRQVSMATLSWTETHRHFPAASVYRETAHHPLWVYRNWVVDVLPHLNQQSIADRWNHDQPISDVDNQALAGIHISTLSCPSDISVAGKGDLSFALNRGIGLWLTENRGDCDAVTTPFYEPLDLGGHGERCAGNAPSGQLTNRQLYRRLTLIFDAVSSPAEKRWKGLESHHRPGDVFDGLSNTLLLVENVRTGYSQGEYLANWSSADPRRTGVYFSHRICPDQSCLPETVNLSHANSGIHAINAGRHQPEGKSPWPGSFHSGGVNAAFADGHVRFLSESTDGLVYYSLFTPQASTLRDSPLDPGVSVSR